MAATPRPDSQRGGFLLAVLVAVIGSFLLAVVVLDACFDDDNAAVAATDLEGHVGRDGERRRCDDRSCRSDEHSDCEDNDGHCSDDDFSPSLDNSPIIICLPDGCRFEPQPEAA